MVQPGVRSTGMLHPVHELCLVHAVSLRPGERAKDDYRERADLPEAWSVFRRCLRAKVRCLNLLASVGRLWGQAPVRWS